MSDVTILFGGTSSERRVAVASGQNVASFLTGAETWFIAPSGAVFKVLRDDLARFDRPFERDFVPKGEAAFPDLLRAIYRTVAYPNTAPSRQTVEVVSGSAGPQ